MKEKVKNRHLGEMQGEGRRKADTAVACGRQPGEGRRAASAVAGVWIQV